MSSHPLSSPVHPFRHFTFELDGIPYSKIFDHPVGVSPSALDLELNREFHAWLESVRPGWFSAGRVLRIAFTDAIRHAKNRTDVADGAAWGTLPALPAISESVVMAPSSVPSPCAVKEERTS